MTVISHSPAETEAAGFVFARQLEKDDIVGLYGELGSGKTSFVKGAARALAVKDTVNSPTFSLVNIYQGRKTVFHMDAFRLKSPEEMIHLGFEEFITQPGVCFIEWADRVEAVIPADAIRVIFKIIDHDSREIIIN
jgi:tRNA threonylcarbamoyladenosine biosynthesis protein TsaE